MAVLHHQQHGLLQDLRAPEAHDVGVPALPQEADLPDEALPVPVGAHLHRLDGHAVAPSQLPLHTRCRRVSTC